MKPVPKFIWPKKKPKGKPKKGFYRSIEWRQLRYQVLKEQKGRCQCCGGRGRDGVRLHVDHIIPISHDASLRLEKSNLQVLCEDCNLGKGHSDRIDWRAV